MIRYSWRLDQWPVVNTYFVSLCHLILSSKNLIWNDLFRFFFLFFPIWSLSHTQKKSYWVLFLCLDTNKNNCFFITKSFILFLLSVLFLYNRNAKIKQNIVILFSTKNLSTNWGKWTKEQEKDTQRKRESVCIIRFGSKIKYRKCYTT